MTFILCLALLGGALFGVQAYQNVDAEKQQLTKEVIQKDQQIKALNQKVVQLKAKKVSHIDGVTVTDLEK